MRQSLLEPCWVWRQSLHAAPPDSKILVGTWGNTQRILKPQSLFLTEQSEPSVADKPSPHHSWFPGF